MHNHPAFAEAVISNYAMSIQRDLRMTQLGNAFREYWLLAVVFVAACGEIEVTRVKGAAKRVDSNKAEMPLCR